MPEIPARRFDRRLRGTGLLVDLEDLVLDLLAELALRHAVLVAQRLLELLLPAPRDPSGASLKNGFKMA